MFAGTRVCLHVCMRERESACACVQVCVCVCEGMFTCGYISMHAQV